MTILIEAWRLQAAIVVRATSCEDVGVDQAPAQATRLCEIGINREISMRRECSLPLHAPWGSFLPREVR